MGYFIRRNDIGGLIGAMKNVASVYPLLLYPMTDISGITIKDWSGNGFDGTALKSVDVGLNFGLHSRETCLKFYPTGNLAWYNAKLASIFNPNEMTFGIFAKVLNSEVWTDGATRRIFGMDFLNSSKFIRLYKVDPKIIRLQVNFGTTRGIDANPISRNDWMFFITTISSSKNELKLYLDGVLVNNQTNSGFGTWDNSTPLQDGCAAIGNGCYDAASSFGLPFFGCLSYFCIWPTVLEQPQIQTIYNAVPRE